MFEEKITIKKDYNLKEGDLISVTTSEFERREYKITKVEQIPNGVELSLEAEGGRQTK